MERHSASYPNLQQGLVPSLRPLRLVRTFRTDFRPIPFFLQDLLAEAPCHSCSEQQGRLLDLVKNVQFQRPLDERCQGKLWFEIRRLLKKDTLSDESLFTDGRAVRNHLMRSIQKKEEEFPISPNPQTLLCLRAFAKKVELPVLRSPVVTLSLTRQTSS
jgi:hypothetical protein